MLFAVNVLFRVHPVGSTSELVEDFTLTVDAQTFNEAQELAFAKLKAAASVESLMSELANEPQKGNAQATQ